MRFTSTIVTDNLNTFLVTSSRDELIDDFGDYCIDEIIRIYKGAYDFFLVVNAIKEVKLNYISYRLKFKNLIVFHKVI